MPLKATEAGAPDELEDELEDELDEELELVEELDELELLRVFLLVLLITGVEPSPPVLAAVFLPPPPPPQAVKSAKMPATPHCLTLAAPKQFH